MNFEDASILVVDDEPALCKIFAAWLERAGCRSVRTAKDGQEALSAMLEQPIDLLITDVRMPNLDGISLVRCLRAHEEVLPKILFISGFGDVDKREMYDLGVEAFLPKPLDRRYFVEQARRALMDKSDLLSAPLTEAPKQTLLIEEATLAIQIDQSGDCQPTAAGTVCVGRGGFAVSHPGVLTLGKVAFTCRFPTERIEMIGHGYVRWYDRAQQIYGVEFSFLAEPGRSLILEDFQFNQCKSFIPAACPTTGP